MNLRNCRKNGAASRRGSRWGVILLLLVAAAIRLLYAREYVQRPESRHLTLDALYHAYWANALVTGDWTPPATQLDPEIQQHPYFRPPGYPFFAAAILAAAHGAWHAPMLAQMALGVASVWLALRIGRRWAGAGIGWGWAIGMALTWSFPYFEGEWLEPALLVFLGLSLVGLLAFWLDDRFGWPGFGAGILMGLYALVRPNALVLAPFIMFWGLWVARRRKRVRGFAKGAVVFALATAAVLAPAAIRNHRVSGEWVLVSANGGVNLYCGNNPNADGYNPGAPEIGFWESFDYARLLKTLPSRPGMTYTEADREFSRRAWVYIRTHPGRTVQLLWRKTLLFWGPREVGNNKDDDLERQASAVLRKLPLTFALAHAGFWLGAGLLFWSARRKRQSQTDTVRRAPVELAVLLAVLAFSLFVSYLPFIVSGRYRIPVIPFLLFFGAYAVHQIIEFVRERQWRLLAGWGLTAAGLVVLTHVNWAGFEPDETGFLYGRGRSYDLDGQTAVAARFFQQAAEREPRYSRKLTLAARSYMARGRAEAALVRLRHAVAGNPRDPEAWLLLAEILDGQGRADEARRALQDGMKQNSASASLRRALASHETNP